MRQCFLRIAARKANFSYNETFVLRGSTVFISGKNRSIADKQKQTRLGCLTMIIISNIYPRDFLYDWRISTRK